MAGATADMLLKDLVAADMLLKDWILEQIYEEFGGWHCSDASHTPQALHEWYVKSDLSWLPITEAEWLAYHEAHRDGVSTG